MTNQKIYSAFGLKIKSEIELPEILPLEGNTDLSENSVHVRQGDVPTELSDGERITYYMAVGKDVCLYTFSGVGRLMISGGREITFELDPDGIESDMRAYIIGSGLGTVLHQRKMIPLHISAVLSPKGVVAFTGQSGEGKSTACGLLHRRTGWPMITDDLAVLDPSDQRPKIYAGVVRLKLWKDAVANFSPDETRVTRDFSRLDKFHIHAPELFAETPCDLSHLLMLQSGDIESFEPHAPGSAFQMLMSSIYRPELVTYFNDPVSIFRKVTQVAQQVQVKTFTRVRSQQGLHASIDALVKQFS